MIFDFNVYHDKERLEFIFDKTETKTAKKTVETDV